jgi:hypothetical protein
MLEMLWRDELVEACRRLRVAIGARAARHSMMRAILQVCRGHEIEAEVCRALRRREFAEADAPILEVAA